MDTRTVGRIALMGLSLAFVAGTATFAPGSDWARFWPVVPIVVGIILLR